MKRNKIIVLLTAGLTLIPQLTFADSCFYDVGTQKVEFMQETEILFPVIAYEKESGEYVYIKEVKDGDKFLMPGDSPCGTYVLSLANKEFEFIHIDKNSENVKNAIKEIVNASSISAVADGLEKNSDILNISGDDLTEYKDSVSEILFKLKNKNDNVETFFNNYNFGILLCKTKGKESFVVEDILKENQIFLKIDMSELEKADTDVKTEFYDRFCKAVITEKKDVRNISSVWLGLAFLNNAENKKEYKDILNKYKDVLSIDASVVTDNKNSENIIENLMAKKMNTSIELKNAIENAVENAEKDGNRGDRGSSGGSGGSGGSKVTMPANIKNDIVFPDVADSHWAYNSIKNLKEKGIVSGRDNNFYPQDKIKRGEIAKMISDAFFKNEQGENTSFSDVSSNDWFYPYVSLLESKNIVNGVSENMFAPESFVTRQDMVVMVVRCIEDKGISFDDVKTNRDFTDDDKIANYSKKSVYFLCRKGIINGMPDGSFRPNDNLTRAEAAVIIDRIITR